MKLNKKLLVLLAVFMLILSAGAVSADDMVTPADDDAGDGLDDGNDDADDMADEGDDDVEEEIDDIEYNETEEGLILNAAYEEPTYSDGASVPAKNTSNLDKNAAGNPVLLLLASIAGIGLTTLKRRY